MSLLDLGLDIPATSGGQPQQAQQPQQPQQQQQTAQTANPFADFQNVSQQQQQQQQQQQANNADPFGLQQPPPQQQQQSNTDPFGLEPPSSVNLVSKTTEQQQQPDGFDAPTPTNTPQQTLQPHELNFGVFEETKQSAPAQQASPSEEVPVTSAAAIGTGSGDGEPSAGTGSEVSPASTENAVNEANEASGGAIKEKLKEIEKLFGGKWRLLRSDPYGEYLKAVGVGLLTRNRASGGTPDLQISVLHEYIFLNTSSMLHSQIIKLKLDESVENLVYKANQSVFCAYQNEKLELQMTPVDVAWSKTQGVEYSINERGELIVVYASGSNVCRRYFAKVVQVTK